MVGLHIEWIKVYVAAHKQHHSGRSQVFYLKFKLGKCNGQFVRYIEASYSSCIVRLFKNCFSELTSILETIMKVFIEDDGRALCKSKKISQLKFEQRHRMYGRYSA